MTDCCICCVGTLHEHELLKCNFFFWCCCFQDKLLINNDLSKNLFKCFHLRSWQQTCTTWIVLTALTDVFLRSQSPPVSQAVTAKEQSYFLPRYSDSSADLVHRTSIHNNLPERTHSYCEKNLFAKMSGKNVTASSEMCLPKRLPHHTTPRIKYIVY